MFTTFDILLSFLKKKFKLSSHFPKVHIHIDCESSCKLRFHSYYCQVKTLWFNCFYDIGFIGAKLHDGV